jgi:rod shape-determining protein MreC
VATRRTRRSITTFVALTLISIILIAFSGQASSGVIGAVKSVGSAVVSPVVGIVDAVTRPIGNLFAGAINYGAVSAENGRLRATIGRLEQQRRSTAFQAQQLKELSTLQDVPFLGSLKTVTAATTSIDASNFAATITVNKGTDDGVAIGMPVVGGGGLVGQVIDTTGRSSIIRLVTDGASHVGGVFGRSSTYGVVNGAAAGRLLSVDYVAPHTKVRVGQTVYTNGLNGAEYPAGIPVGTVRTASTPVNSIQMAISLAPAADLDHLAFVDIVIWVPAR